MRGALFILLVLVASCGDDNGNVDMSAGETCTLGSTCSNGQKCCAGCPGMQSYCGPCLGISCQTNDSCTMAGGSCNGCGQCAAGFHEPTNTSLYACPLTPGPGCFVPCCFPDRDGGL